MCLKVFCAGTVHLNLHEHSFSKCHRRTVKLCLILCQWSCRFCVHQTPEEEGKIHQRQVRCPSAPRILGPFGILLSLASDEAQASCRRGLVIGTTKRPRSDEEETLSNEGVVHVLSSWLGFVPAIMNCAIIWAHTFDTHLFPPRISLICPNTERDATSYSETPCNGKIGDM